MAPMERFARGLALAALGLAGCATLACEPATITVAAKEQRTRLEREFRGVTTDQLGRVAERWQDVPVREYWVKDPDGRWYRVSEAAWRTATVGESLEVCR